VAGLIGEDVVKCASALPESTQPGAGLRHCSSNGFEEFVV
jgi:hypothetical protein